MLEDIQKITSIVFDQFINTNLKVSSPHNLYDIHRSMQNMISNIDTVSEHYLALDFSEDFLQGSSFGKPEDKWRKFFNKDLEDLNDSVKSYLLNLYYLSIENSKYHGLSETLLSRVFNTKTLYSVIRDQYDCGNVEPCGFNLISVTLEFNNEPESLHIIKHKKINLSTYKERVNLQQKLRLKKDFLKEQSVKLKVYLQKHYSIEDIL